MTASESRTGSRRLPVVVETRLLPHGNTLDGTDTTVWASEVGLDGPDRLLAWVAVYDDDNRPQIHMLVDTHNIDDALEAGITEAARQFSLTTGVAFATTTSVKNATIVTYP